MDSEIRKYCKHIQKTHNHDVLRFDPDKKVKYWDLPAAASVCYGFGSQARGCSQSPQGKKWIDALRRVMCRLGTIGKPSRISRNVIGRCAEQHSCNNLGAKVRIASEGDLRRIRFSDTVRPRTMQVLDPCANCKSIFPTL